MSQRYSNGTGRNSTRERRNTSYNPPVIVDELSSSSSDSESDSEGGSRRARPSFNTNYATRGQCLLLRAASGLTQQATIAIPIPEWWVFPDTASGGVTSEVGIQTSSEGMVITMFPVLIQ